jgi:predicted nucleotidyltransferase
MITSNEILKRVKKAVHSVMPDATVILYGSFARGESKPDSDIDLLVLINKMDVSRDDEILIKYPLYEIEFDTGTIISPLVLSKFDWESKHRITPFYDNIGREGIIL